MQVICPKCSTEYVLDATKIPTQGALLPCATCGEKFAISPTPEETAAPVEENAAPVDNPFDDLNLNIEAQEESSKAPDFANEAPAFLDNIPLSDAPEENKFETELTTDDFTTLDLSFEPLQIADHVDNTKPEDDMPAEAMDSVPDMDAMGFDFADLELADEMTSSPAEPTSDTGPSQSSDSQTQDTPLSNDPFAALDLEEIAEQSPTEETPEEDPFAALDLEETPEKSPTEETPEEDPFAALDLGETTGQPPAEDALKDDPFAALDLGETTEQSSAPQDKELDPFAGYQKETDPESSFEAAQEDDFADLDMDFADDAFLEKPNEESTEEATQNESDPFGDLDFNADNAITSDVADTPAEPEEAADTTSEPDGDKTDTERRPTLTSLPNVFDDEESEAVDMDAIDSDEHTVDAPASPTPQEPPQEPLQDEHGAGEALDENAQTPGPIDDLPTVFEDEHDYAGERINTGHIETGVNAALAEAFGDDADLDAIESLEPPTRYNPKALLENYKSRPKKIQAAIASSALLLLGALGYLVFTLAQSEAPTEIAQVAPKQLQEEKTEVLKETEAEEPEIQEPELPVLTQESVYYLGYNALEQRARQLFESSVAKNSKPTPLLLWAWLRLSQVYQLKSAQKQLLKALQRGPLVPNKDMAAALNLTYLSLTGKTSKAILKAKLRLKKNKIENSPHVSFVLAQIYLQKKKNAAALKLLLPFSEKTKPWLDVQIQSIELLAQKGSANNERIQSVVSKLLEVNPSAATLARLARFALTNKNYQLAETTLSKLDIEKEYLAIPEIHRENAFQDVLYYQIRQGMLIKALETAKLWTETIPESLNAAIQTSRLLTQMKKGQSFLTDLLANAKSRQEKSVLLAEEIRLARSQKRQEHARNIFETHRSSLTKPWRYYLEAIFDLDQKDTETAKQKLKKAIQLKPTLFEAQILLAQLEKDRSIRNQSMTELGKTFDNALIKQALLKTPELISIPKERLHILNALLWQAPTIDNPIRLMLIWCRLMTEHGDSEKALSVLKNIQSDFPSNPLPIFTRAQIAERGGHIDEAVKHYKTIIELDSKNERWHMKLAALLLKHDRRLESINVIERLFSKSPEARNHSTLLILSKALADNDRVQAKLYLRESLRLKPTAQGCLLLAEFSMEDKNYREALTYFRQAYDIAPQKIPVIYALAQSEFQQQNLEITLKLLKEVLALDSQHYLAWELLADTYREQGNLTDALKTYRKASEFTDEKSPLYMKIARLELQELNRLQSAMQTLKKAIEADNENADAYYYLGYAQKDLGRWQAASVSLKMYLKLNPRSGFALEVKQDIADLETRDAESERPF